MTTARLRRARVAVSLGFLVFGTQLGLWFAHIPELARRLALEPARLGLGILGIGAIGLIAQPLTGLALARFGSRRTTRVLLPAFVAAETLLICAPSQPLFFACAALVGLAGMPANVGNNTLAAELERRYGRPIMSSFHAWFSVGGLAGSLIGGALVATRWAGGAIAVGAALFVASLWAMRHALDEPGTRDHAPRFAIPARGLLAICIVALCTHLIEGSVGDWSALYLATIKRATPALAASGYTLFSIAMAIVRFAGGPIAARLGARSLLVASGACMAAGLGIVVLAPWPLVAALGFLVVAVGVANIAPLITSAAARAPGVPPSIGVAALSTFITLGLFAGPPALGFIAQTWDLDAGFRALAVLAVLVTLATVAARAPAP